MILAIVLSLVIHELGHIVTALCLGLKIRRVGISWKGPYIVRESGAPFQNALVTFAGPLANLITAALCHGDLRLYGLVLGLTNLIPAWGSDGQRLWKLIICLRRTATAVLAPEDNEGLGCSII